MNIESVYSRTKQYTPAELMKKTDSQLRRLVPYEYRPFYPGKKELIEMDWCFYLHDGTAWDMLINNFRDV